MAWYFPRSEDQIDAYWRGEMTSRRLRVLIQRLPPESATMTALRNELPQEELDRQAEEGEPEKGRWSQLEQLVAGNSDAIRYLTYVLAKVNHDGKGPKPKAPEPMRRPGVTRSKKQNKINDAQADRLFELINGGAA